jgi:hypothetical protein
MQDEKILLELARLILPSGFIENFKITNIISNDSDVEISLDEFDALPEERRAHKIESKGFLDAVTVRDFPLRDKRVNFKVRRRKWYDHTTCEYFTNSYDTVYKGTRYSKEFAVFLKALPRDISPIGPFA